MLYLLSAGCQYVPDDNNKAHWSEGSWGGGPRALYLWPRSEPGASERLLSAWSVLINIPSSQVMINANPIGCASDESPVSQNEVGLRLPRWSPSSSHKRSIKHDESGPGGNEADDFWHFRLRDGEFETEPEITNGGRRSITSLVPLKYKHLNIQRPRRLKCLVFGEYFSFLHGAERGGCFGEFFSRLTDSCRMSRGRSANTPSDAQQSPWGTGHTGPAWQSSGAVRSPRWGPDLSGSSIRGQKDTSWGETFDDAGMAEPSLKAYGVKTNTLVLLVEITISVTLITRYNKHTRSSYFKLTPSVLLYFFSLSSTESTSFLYSRSIHAEMFQPGR